MFRSSISDVRFATMQLICLFAFIPAALAQLVPDGLNETCSLPVLESIPETSSPQIRDGSSYDAEGLIGILQDNKVALANLNAPQQIAAEAPLIVSSCPSISRYLSACSDHKVKGCNAAVRDAVRDEVCKLAKKQVDGDEEVRGFTCTKGTDQAGSTCVTDGKNGKLDSGKCTIVSDIVSYEPCNIVLTRRRSVDEQPLDNGEFWVCAEMVASCAQACL